MIKKSNDKPIVITMGDPSGISGEILLKTWLEKEKENIPIFFSIDSPERLNNLSHFLNLKVPIKEIDNPMEAKNYFSKYLPVLGLNSKIKSKLGSPDINNNKYIIESIEESVDLAIKKEVKAIVTNPISKSILLETGFKYFGQTEFISEIISKKEKKKFEEIMILTTTKPEDTGVDLRVGLITTHLPISKVSKELTTSKIISKTESFIESLKNLWNIPKPNIAICGLNPHIGEDGKLGSEENQIIQPAIKNLKAKKYNVSGPVSADTCFSKYKRHYYDGFVCMYHDQGLIPVKTIDFLNSVNITGGIPIIRTSPDHGPAFDIAKLNLANNKSLIASIKLAEHLCKNST
ncbi:4-hydroxythreonine-4-phosphate dehydrogenase PdxA [Rickettsiales bacterium]|nr:4-hydroxythreonine-4-phosphate dehydrogenase PdxA [Rickettsiales bacterium]